MASFIPVAHNQGKQPDFHPQTILRDEGTEVQEEQAGIRTEQSRTKANQSLARQAQAAIQAQQDKTRTNQGEMRVAQARKRILEQTLRTSELSYRRLFEAAQDGILILEADTGRISDVNPFLCQLLGYYRAETNRGGA